MAGAGRAAAGAGRRRGWKSGDNEKVGNQRSADRLRGRIGAAIFERVAGPQGPTRRRRIAQTGGERWFAEDRPVRQVQGDSSMFVGGISALLLQSLHPLAMAAVAQHSDYRGDPWGRLQRTSYFLAVTTFGQAADAEEAIARVKAVHRHVTGTAPDGRTAVRGFGPAPADLGAHRRGGQLPARSYPVRRASPRSGRARRLRRGHGPDRPKARRARSAADRSRAG